MDKVIQYKKIIVISSLVMLWATIINVVVHFSIMSVLMVCIATIVALLIVFLYKNFIVTEKIIVGEKVFESLTETEQAVSQSDCEVCDRLEQYVEEIPTTKHISEMAHYAMSAFAQELELVVGIWYQKTDESLYSSIYSYAIPEDFEFQTFAQGDGLVGQAIEENKIQCITDIPEDYPSVVSGLGQATPRLIVIVPLSHNNKCVSVVELGFFTQLSTQEIQQIQKFLEIVTSRLYD